MILDAQTARSRSEAMEAARLRMQEQHDAKAALHAEETKKVQEHENGILVRGQAQTDQ